MAYTVDDLFERESFLGDPNDLDNLVEFRETGNNSDGDVQDAETGDRPDDGDDDDGEKKDGDGKDSAKEKKVVRIKRPQPKLDAERLKGPRGLKELRKTAETVKFRGKGHEAEDLIRIMSRLEHWSHRLFPKFQFDDFLEKVEKLGTKKVVQNYVKRLRMGLEDDDDNRPPRSEDEEDVDDPDPIADQTDFDRLLAEQVSLHQSSVAAPSPRTPAVPTPKTPAVPFSRTQAVSSTPVPSLSDEQKERIERNRRAAMEKRRARAALQTDASVPSTEFQESSASSNSPLPKQGMSSELSSEAKGSSKMDTVDQSDLSADESTLTLPVIEDPRMSRSSAEASLTDEPNVVMEDLSGKVSEVEAVVKAAVKAAVESGQVPDVAKHGDTKESEEKSEVTSSDDDSCDPKKSSASSDSSVSETSGKRSVISEDEESSKKKKMDPVTDRPEPPSPGEDSTSWGLAAFMSKDD